MLVRTTAIALCLIFGAPVPPVPYTFSEPIHAAARVPVALNTFAVWVAMMIALTLVNYGWPT